MPNCFQPIAEQTPSKFVIAVHEELPKLHEDLTAFLGSSEPTDFIARIYFSMELLKILEDLYDKEGRAGLRKFGKIGIRANSAHENSHEDSEVSVNTGLDRGQ